MVGQYLKIEEGTNLHCWTVEPQKSNSSGVQEVPEIRTTKTITMGGEEDESETQMEENSMTHTLNEENPEAIFVPCLCFIVCLGIPSMSLYALS